MLIYFLFLISLSFLIFQLLMFVFLSVHRFLGLVKTIPQMNNFVVYDGFFDSDQNDNVLNGNNGDQRIRVTDR